MSDAFRGLGWAHGALTVQRHAAMLAPLTFLLPDGRQVSPMHVAPWAGEPEADALPGILQRLRGEWPCVPFGYSVPGDASPPDWAAIMGAASADEEVHGHSSNHPWRWMDNDGTSLRLAIDYPDGAPVSRLERTVTPDADAPAVDLTLTIHVRTDCRLPIGLHPTFRLPSANGMARIEPAAFHDGRTYPGSVEPGRELFLPDQVFASLGAVPTRTGTVLDATRVPLGADTEELIELNRIDGGIALANLAEGYRAKLSWNPEHFPSVLLWYSNRGRTAYPWNGRHVALGMEPICSPFGLGPATALADNPIARSGTPTARSFKAGEVFTTRYRIEVEAI
jgi:hypothetical protein